MVSFSSFKRKVQTKDSVFHEEGKKIWGNQDLDPTPPSMRSWGYFNYFIFWWAVSFNPNQWNTGSSLVSLGLVWWLATISIIVGNIICGFILVAASRGASVYHLGFPAFIRVAAGMWGSMFFIFLRGVVAILYFATQTFYAGNLTDVMLRCAFGSSWMDIGNTLPASAGTTSRQLLAFFIFWIIQFPFMLIHPERAKYLYTVKSCLAPPVLFAVFAFVIAKNGGTIGDGSQLAPQSTDPSVVGWAFMAGINAVAGSLSPEITSNPDLARYARTPGAITWPQFVGIVLSKSLVIFMGIASTSAGKSLWGTAYWNMWDLFGAILTNYWSAGTRCAVFLACFVQIMAVLATNLASNCLPVGADLTGLFPRYFTIVRGQALCAILSLACVPWKIISSAQNFLTFLGSYVCFVSPVIFIMIMDYFFIRKGNVHVPSAYNGSSSSPYWYYHGFNLRMYAAWIAGVVITIHGLAGAYNPSISAASKHMYTLGFLLSGATSSVVYIVLCKVKPFQIYPLSYATAPRTREFLAANEGYFEDEQVLIVGIESPQVYDNKVGEVKAEPVV